MRTVLFPLILQGELHSREPGAATTRQFAPFSPNACMTNLRSRPQPQCTESLTQFPGKKKKQKIYFRRVTRILKKCRSRRSRKSASECSTGSRLQALQTNRRPRSVLKQPDPKIRHLPADKWIPVLPRWDRFLIVDASQAAERDVIVEWERARRKKATERAHTRSAGLGWARLAQGDKPATLGLVLAHDFSGQPHYSRCNDRGFSSNNSSVNLPSNFLDAATHVGYP